MCIGRSSGNEIPYSLTLYTTRPHLTFIIFKAFSSRMASGQGNHNKAVTGQRRALDRVLLLASDVRYKQIIKPLGKLIPSGWLQPDTHLPVQWLDCRTTDYTTAFQPNSFCHYLDNLIDHSFAQPGFARLRRFRYCNLVATLQGIDPLADGFVRPFLVSHYSPPANCNSTNSSRSES